MSSISVYISGLHTPAKVTAEKDAEKDATEKDADKDTDDKDTEKKAEIKFENCTDDQEKTITIAANSAVDYISSCQTYVNSPVAQWIWW